MYSYGTDKLQHYGYRSGYLTWHVDVDYVLVEWVGLKHRPETTDYYGGLLTKLNYLEEATTIEKVFPLENPDSFLLNNLQTLRLLRWGKDPTEDVLVSGNIGWVEPNAGKYEKELRRSARDLLSRIRKDPYTALDLNSQNISEDLEFLAYSLLVIKQQEEIATKLIQKYQSNWNILINEIKNVVVRNDYALRYKFGDHILQSVYSKLPKPLAVYLNNEDKYITGPHIILIDASRQEMYLELARKHIFLEIRNLYQKL